MSLLDLLRQEYVTGKVIDKYRISNGNIGVVVEDGAAHKRYHVEFRDNYKGPCVENLFGLLKEPFSGKTEHLNRLIKEGDSIELTVSYSKGPLREAYYIHSVSNLNSRSMPYKSPQKLISLPYRSAQTQRY